MKLSVIPLEQSKAIRLTLAAHGQKWHEIAPTGEDLVPTLDKILKKANIDHSNLTNIIVRPQKQASLTSLRLATTVQRALTLIHSQNPRDI
jgi:hypothetical protein